jgi:hypothetical protein
MKNKVIILFFLFFVVCMKSTSTELRRPISTSTPMYLFHIDVWNYADPQKIINLVPEDIRPYVVFNISLSVSLTKYGYSTAESWLRTCAENGVWATIQPASGGHCHFSDKDYSVYEYFFKNYPNFLGFNFAEQFWGFDTTDGLHPDGGKTPSFAERCTTFANLLKIANTYGGYLIVSTCKTAPSYGNTSPLATFKEHSNLSTAAKNYKDNFIYCEKYTSASGYYDMESQCLGVYLSDYCGNYGMRFDECGYEAHKNREATFPEAIGGMTILEHMMMTGQTVEDGPELIWKQVVKQTSNTTTTDGFTTKNWQLYSQFNNVYADVFRKFVVDKIVRIMPRKEVIDSTKIAIFNNNTTGSVASRRTAEALFTGLYAMDNGTWENDSVYLKKTGRYPAIPTLWTNGSYGFGTTVYQTAYNIRWSNTNAKVAEFNKIFPAQSTGNMYVRHIDNNWLVYNPNMDKNLSASSSFNLLYNSCSSINLNFPRYSFGIVTEKSDSIYFYLNNYRSSTTTKTSDTITISGCSSEPAFSYKDRGNHGISTISKTYIDGIFTLIVRHNGPLDLFVRCTGNGTNRLTVPEENVMISAETPQRYTGTRQYEAENFDYKNISKIDATTIHQYTAYSYMDFGKKSTAAVRDTISVPSSGTYTLSTRYTAPEGDVNSVDLYVNGNKLSTLHFTKTEVDSLWTTLDKNITLNNGKNVIMFKANSTATYNLYLDNITLTSTTSTSISTPNQSDTCNSFDIYNLNGQMIRNHATTLQGLKNGIYIVNNKKVVIK